MTSMEQTTQQNAAVAQQSAAARHNLAIMAGELQKLVNRFKLSNAVEKVQRKSQCSNNLLAADQAQDPFFDCGNLIQSL